MSFPDGLKRGREREREREGGGGGGTRLSQIARVWYLFAAEIPFQGLPERARRAYLSIGWERIPMQNLAWKLAIFGGCDRHRISGHAAGSARHESVPVHASKRTRHRQRPARQPPTRRIRPTKANPPEHAKPDARRGRFRSNPSRNPRRLLKSAQFRTGRPPAAKIAADTGSQSAKTAEIPTAAKNGRISNQAGQ